MLRSNSNGDLYYTKGDEFRFLVTSDEGFSEGSTLRLVIARNENEADLINEVYTMTEGGFWVDLSDEGKEKLRINDDYYLYKLVLCGSDGTVITQTSGNLRVGWGA